LPQLLLTAIALTATEQVLFSATGATGTDAPVIAILAAD